MEIIPLVLGALTGLLVLANIVFTVLVCIQMFKHEQTGLGIACLVLTFLCLGLGQPVAFIMGWVKAGEWNIKRTMFAWTGLVVMTLMCTCFMGVGSMTLGQQASSTFGTVSKSIGGGGSGFKK